MSDIIPSEQHPTPFMAIDPASPREHDGTFRPEFIIFGYRDTDGQFVIVGSDTLTGIEVDFEYEDPEWDICALRSIPPRLRGLDIKGRCHDLSIAWSESYGQAVESVLKAWKDKR